MSAGRTNASALAAGPAPQSLALGENQAPGLKTSDALRRASALSQPHVPIGSLAAFGSQALSCD
jgi:hypothetical protein